MRTVLAAVVLSGGVVSNSVSMVAHHSFAAEFDANKPVTLRGTLVRMDWINPHAWIFLNVKDASGKMVEWAVETAPPNALIRRGFRKTSLPPGTEIVINGFKAKNGSNSANGYNLTLPMVKRSFWVRPAPARRRRFLPQRREPRPGDSPCLTRRPITEAPGTREC